MFTHLGNGCPQLLQRHDNIIERTLSLYNELWISFIGDGAHVPFSALGNYLRVASIKRCVIVSDAICAAGLGPGSYTVANQTVNVGEDRVPRSADGDHFVGSATSLSQMAERLGRDLRLSEDEVRHLTAVGPRTILQGDRQTSLHCPN
jgi:N-acetylglucosamine-6-phosphate deacetylase